MARWVKSKSPGVRYRTHPERKHGVKFDRYFSIRYRVNGKLREEGLGWSSAGWTDKKAADTLAELRANKTTGSGPKTLKEKRDMRLKAEQEEVERKQTEEANQRLKDRTILSRIFDEYAIANEQKKSLRDEKSYFKNWIKPTLGEKRLDEIVPLDLERIRKKMTMAGKAQRSIQYVKSIIRQVYHFAIAHNLFTGEVPTTNFLKKQHTDNRRQRYLSPVEAEELLNKVREYSEKTYQISLVSLHTGMRFGEIASLLWQHINTENHEIMIFDPKNSETRTVFMTDRMLNLFKSMTRGRRNELVFPSNKGKKRGRVSKVFAQAVDDLKLNEDIEDRRLRVVFHTLRHSCASTLVNAGVEIPVIAKILGHKTLAMTMRYSHINDNSVKSAMAILDGEPTTETEKVVAIK